MRSPRSGDLFFDRVRLLSWLVSNCKTPSRRDLIWTELEKYIPKKKMMMFGKCSKGKGRIGSKKEVQAKLLDRSKFYFAA